MTKFLPGKHFLLSAIMGSMHPGDSTSNPAKQGIEGYVYRISGNQMPSPQIKPAAPQSVKAVIYIYALTNIKQVGRQGQTPFYATIRTTCIKTATSDTSGYFNVQLPPGRYSLFTKKDTLFYANWFDKDNNISPVEVLSGKMTKAEIRIDYDAAY